MLAGVCTAKGFRAAFLTVRVYDRHYAMFLKMISSFFLGIFMRVLYSVCLFVCIVHGCALCEIKGGVDFVLFGSLQPLTKRKKLWRYVSKFATKSTGL